MGILSKIKHKWLRYIGMGLSLTTIAFVFQACYGPPRDYKRDRLIEGLIVDVNNNPISGIKVSADSTMQYAVTKEDGTFHMYLPFTGEYHLMIEDEREEGKYMNKDTTLMDHNISGEPLLIRLESKF